MYTYKCNFQQYTSSSIHDKSRAVKDGVAWAVAWAVVWAATCAVAHAVAWAMAHAVARAAALRMGNLTLFFGGA